VVSDKQNVSSSRLNCPNTRGPASEKLHHHRHPLTFLQWPK